VTGQPVFVASKGKNMSKLREGKVAVITGGGQGVGLASPRSLSNRERSLLRHAAVRRRRPSRNERK
jgi:NAD(P)-dependent dehydrogenase (short-subunit alcohol dehydrogenase family)